MEQGVGDGEGTAALARAAAVERRQHVGGAAEVSVATCDAAAGAHAPVQRRLHHDDLALAARRVERLQLTVVVPVCKENRGTLLQFCAHKCLVSSVRSRDPPLQWSPTQELEVSCSRTASSFCVRQTDIPCMKTPRISRQKSVNQGGSRKLEKIQQNRGHSFSALMPSLGSSDTRVEN